LQLYVNKDRKVVREIVEKVEKLGCKALFITVDAPQLGRREKDMRNKFTAKEPDVEKGKKLDRSQGTARAISGFIDPGLCWNDLKWYVFVFVLFMFVNVCLFDLYVFQSDIDFIQIICLLLLGSEQ